MSGRRNAPLACAVALAGQGYAVFFCRGDKKPACLHGFLDATRDPAEITKLWKRWPGVLVGVATGEASGVAVLDIDPDGLDWWDRNSHRLYDPAEGARSRQCAPFPRADCATAVTAAQQPPSRATALASSLATYRD
jgi:Bifunctional DNA primase/polymerase, N-terminal